MSIDFLDTEISAKSLQSKSVDFQNSEIGTKSLQSISRNARWTLTLTSLNLGVSLLTGVFLPKSIGIEKMGEYTCIVWVANWSGMLGQTGINQAVQRYVSELWSNGLCAEAKTLTLRVLKIQLLVSVSIASLLLGSFKLNGASAEQLFLLALALCSSCMLTVIGTITCAVNGTQNIYRTSRAALPSTLLGGLALACVLLRGATIAQVLELGALAVSGWALSQIHVFRSVFSMRRADKLPPNLVSPASLFLYSAGLAVCTLLTGLVLDKGELPIIRFFCGDKEVGAFATAVNISQKLCFFPQTIAMMLIPTFTALVTTANVRSAQSVYQWSVRLYALTLAPLAIAIVCLAKPLIISVYGAEFVKCILPLQISCMATVASCIVLPALTACYSEKYVDLSLILKVALVCAVDLTLACLLVPYLGAAGGAAAGATGQIVLAVVVSRHLRKNLQLDLPITFVRRFAICFSSVLLICVAAQVQPWLATTWQLDVVLTTFALALFAFSITKTQCLTPDEIALLKSLFESSLKKRLRKFQGYDLA